MASKGVAILKLLQGTDLKELDRSLKAYLAPLLGISGSGAEHSVENGQRTMAKEYVPFLVQLLKICGAKLASVPSRDDPVAVSMADEVFSAMGVALDGLSVLRSQLTGSSFEVELQRYGLVRRLMVWKRYGAALSQSQVLFRSLCRLTSTTDSEGSRVNKSTSGRTSKRGAVKKKASDVRLLPCDDSVLCPPQEVDLGSGLPALVVASAVDFIWCIAECSEDSSSCCQIAARLPDQLTPWISVLDPGTASKQCDALFRAIYKLTLILVADPTKYDPSSIHQFCIITLSHCESSTQGDQYAKVARKLYSTLSGQGSHWCSKSVEICTSTFSEVLSDTKLRGFWTSYDFAELVEWFARSCQSSSQLEHGWFHIYKLVDHIKQVFPCAPVVITGLYAVGLVLMQADTPEIRIKDTRADSHELADLNILKRFSDCPEFFCKASCLLHSAGEALKLWLRQGQAPLAQKPAENGSRAFGGHTRPGSSDKGTEVMGRTLVSAVRVFHYVQRSFTRYVQIVWNACNGSSSEEELPYGIFNSALQKVLQLFYPVLNEGMRCSDLSDNEKDIFRKGYQMALQASLAALRLSLLLNDGVQENCALIGDMIHKLQPEEKWWLMSSTYNMGVQLFNIKQYSLACWPLDLAHKAAWAKVKSSSSDNKSGASVNDMMSEACAKCLALVDARNRNGEPRLARVILIDGLVQWAQAQTKLHSIKFPHSLVRSFVKLMCAESPPITSNTAENEVRSLYSFIRDIQPPLSVGIVGLLLEAEHTACQAMEEQFPDTCYRMKEQIAEILLNKLYMGPDFVLERSRVLTRKCQDSRMPGAENLPSCIENISEAVVSLEAALEDKKNCTPGRVACLEKQLAIAYSIMGICSYAVDHYCQEFLPNVVLSLNMWRCLLDSDVVHGGLSEPEISSTTAINEEESLVLLLYISELLSIQGYSVLLHEAQAVILKVIRNSKQSIAEKDWVEFWMKGRAGHLLCTVPFPIGVFSTIRQTFNATANSEEFWEGYFNLFPGSLLEAHRHSVQDFLDLECQAIGSGRSTVQKPDAIDRIKNMVYARLSDGQKSIQFTLQTAALYHVLSDLSFGKGDTCEAIRNAKEAFQLRSRLFKYVFRNSGKSASGVTSNTTSNTSESGNRNFLQVREGIGPSATWSWPFSVKLQHCLSHPSHWRILGDYIESLMQVGVIYEQMGAVDEAERNFREGHRLALAQNLPWALASFSSCLGEVHRKRQLWESAGRYFIEAKQVFDDLQTSRPCESCILSGKALLEMRSGDLARHYWYCQQGRRNENASFSNITEAYPAKSLTSALSHYTAAFTSLIETGQKSHPLPFGPLGCSFSIEDWPAYRWTQLGRKLVSRVLLQKGKCHIHLGELDEADQILEKAMSVLNISSLPQLEITAVGRSSFPVEEGALLYHLSRLRLQKEQLDDVSRDAGGFRGDTDYLEKGRVESIRWLYYAFSLCRQVPLLLHKIAKLLAILHVPPSWGGLPSVCQGSVSPDEMAEVAAYFHQASLGTTIRQQHLAVLDSKLDDANVEDSQHIHPSLTKACLEKMQQALRIDPINMASVGKQAREFWDFLPSSLVCCISFVSAEDVNLLKDNCLRSGEESIAVADWLLVTRLSVASKPVVLLLPVLPIVENPPYVGRSKSLEYSSTPYDLSDEDDDDCNIHIEEQNTPPPEVLNQMHKNFHTVLQRVAAEFVSVLEESRLSTSGTQPVITLEEKSIWWKWRMELDRRLSLLLRTVEDSWLGPLKCLLLGEPQQASVAKSFELCTVYLLEMMSSTIAQKRSSSIEQSFVKTVLQAVGCLTAPELEKVIANMLGFRDYQSCDTHANECGADCNACSWKDEGEKYEQIKHVSNSFRAAYVLSTKACESDELKCLLDENNGKRRSKRQVKGKAGSKNQNPLEKALQMVSDGSYSPDAQVQRQPLQLILDSDAQALPWESLPVLRDHEIYRMPSLGTMHAVYIQHQCDKFSDQLGATDIHQAKARKNEEKKVNANKRSSVRAAKEVDSDKHLDVTCVNPNNTYYILNPNGDLPSTQAAFEDWFTKQLGWKGKAGTVPTAEEYQMGLQKHDLFVYLGHGSGDQYLPERYVRQLDHCAASLLMGCSSGRLSLRGEYQPNGVVLSYLMAGCPAVVANLWDVTDGDIDRFSRCLLHSWLASQSEPESSQSEKGKRDMSDCELAMRERQNDKTDFQASLTSKFKSMTLENQSHRDTPSADIHRMGSTIGQSRNACRLPHLIGASPVCYGVPTGVWKQICPNNTT